jgi:hypothetical protein
MVDPQTVASTCHYVGFCALKSADQAAWASAIGSFLAALVALGIALSGGVAKHLPISIQTCIRLTTALSRRPRASSYSS